MIKNHSVENFNSVVKKNKFGKIFKGTNYPAFQKQTLGTIPSKYDSFLFQKQSPPEKFKSERIKIFESPKYYSYELYGNTVKFSFFPKNNEKIEQSENQLNSFNNNNKKYFGGENRFNNIIYRDLEINKYYPGPGQYEINEETLPKYKYNSIFSSKRNYSLINKEINNLGPGSYTYKFPKSEKKIIFSKEKKYPKYNSIFNNDPDDTLIGPGFFDFPSCFEIHNKDRLSPFFINKPKKKINLEKKYIIDEINEKQNKEWSLNDDMPIFVKQSQDDWIKSELNKRMKNDNNKLLKKNKSISAYNELNAFRIRMHEYSIQKGKVNKGFALNNEPKFKTINKKHVPGPCYYNCENIIKSMKNKKNFHTKIKDFWI
jgi:hypothetical protein